MQVVLLAGGLGSRLSEETVSIPKPMVEVCGRPIILHVMDIYSHWGHRDFIVACGYKSFMMKKFFHDLYFMCNDFTVAVHDGNVALRPSRPVDWNVNEHAERPARFCLRPQARVRSRRIDMKQNRVSCVHTP